MLYYDCIPSLLKESNFLHTHCIYVIAVDLFVLKFLSKDAIEYPKEQITYIFFRDLLDEMEGILLNFLSYGE